MRYVGRYNVQTKLWEYGYWMGSRFVIVAKYPEVLRAAA